MSETQTEVRSELVKDDLGIAQCVLATGAMLDLNSLQNHAQRTLLPMSQLDIEKATRSRLLTLINGSGSSYPLPTFVDTCLAGRGNLVIDALGGTLGALRDTIGNSTSLRIKQRPDETLEIPPLSATADPGLAAQVVSLAASPYYAAPGKIRLVKNAIVRVPGLDPIGCDKAIQKLVNLTAVRPIADQMAY